MQNQNQLWRKPTKIDPEQVVPIIYVKLDHKKNQLNLNINNQVIVIDMCSWPYYYNSLHGFP